MTGRTPGPGGGTDDAGVILGGLAAALLVACAAAWLPLVLVAPPGYTGQGLFAAAAGLATGQIEWTVACTAVAAAELVVIAGLAAGAVFWWRRRRRKRTRVDDAARHMARRDELGHLTPAGVTDSARRLRPGTLGRQDAKTIDADETGVPICLTLRDSAPLRQSWEDMAVDIWGPRSGKTTSRAIPATVAAPGPVLVTSTKGDIVDATYGVRAARGTVWAFDPQGIWGQPQRMWVNLLRQIETVSDARRVAEHFAAAERPPDAKPDAFFDPKAQALVANLLLAAACSGRTLPDVYRWATAETNEEPVELLRAGGHQLSADAVASVINLPDRTRGGIYGGAEQLLTCLTEPANTAWVTPPPAGADIIEFDPAAFVATCDTLYLLSEGGPGSPAPLVAALADAVLHAGQKRARTSPGRRLDPPLLSVLDEAANICRIRRLPNLYSFYGSAGLPIITILQSFAQGEEVWGPTGMRKLWSSANVRTYGGGVSDTDFLRRMSDEIGPHDVVVRSTSTSGTGWGNRSVQMSPQQRPILDIAALAALPRGRMIVFSSGARPVLGRSCPWQTGPYADRIRASLAEFDPAGKYDVDLDPATDDPAASDDAQGEP